MQIAMVGPAGGAGAPPPPLGGGGAEGYTIGTFPFWSILYRLVRLILMFDSFLCLLCCILSRGSPRLASHTIPPPSDGECPQISPPGSFDFYEMPGLLVFFWCRRPCPSPPANSLIFSGLQCLFFNKPLVVQALLSPSRYVILKNNPYISFY